MNNILLFSFLFLATGMPVAFGLDDPASEPSISTISDHEIQRLSSRIENAEKLITQLQSEENALINQHNHIAETGTFTHPDIHTLGPMLNKKFLGLRGLKSSFTEAKISIETLEKITSYYGFASTANTVLEGIDILKLSHELKAVAQNTENAGVIYQQAVDEILAKSDLYRFEDFITGIHLNCKHSSAILNCAGFAFNNFARALSLQAVQYASIKIRIDSSNNIIASRLETYINLGIQHARENKKSSFDQLKATALRDIEKLIESVNGAIRAIDDQNWLQHAIHGNALDELSATAQKLKRDLEKGEDSAVMKSFRSAYEDAYAITSLQIRMDRDIALMDSLIAEINAILTIIKELSDQLAKMNEESENNQYHNLIVSCEHSGNRSLPTQHKVTLPAGLSMINHYGLLDRRPSSDEFLSACRTQEQKAGHACTVIYCNHIFFGSGQADILECVAKISAQKCRNTLLQS